MDWSRLYPGYFKDSGVGEVISQLGTKRKRPLCVEFADIGCGYGGLLGESDICMHESAVV